MSDQESTTLWWLYVIRCGDGKFYTGITTDIERRFQEHNETAIGSSTKGAKALRGKAPLSLVYKSEAGNRSEALKLEYKVKQLSKSEKSELVHTQSSVTDYFKYLENNVHDKQL